MNHCCPAKNAPVYNKFHFNIGLCTFGVLTAKTHISKAFLPPTKEELHVFARVCLSVCPLARLLKNAYMDFDEMLRVDRCRDMDELINF